MNAETRFTEEQAIIDIAREFSITPGGRYRHQSKYSGEAFRDDLLLPAMERARIVIVDLDGTRGFSTSFLEESFGGVVEKFGLAYVDEHLRLRAPLYPNRIDLARKYMVRAETKRRSKAKR